MGGLQLGGVGGVAFAWLAHDHLAVRIEVPVANEHTLTRLPESAAEAHHRYLATVHLDGPLDPP